MQFPSNDMFQSAQAQPSPSVPAIETPEIVEPPVAQASYASLGDRLFARAVDLFLFSAIYLLLNTVLLAGSLGLMQSDAYGGSGLLTGFSMALLGPFILLVLVYGAYETLFIATVNATPGKMLFRLSVLDSESFTPLDMISAFKRVAVPILAAAGTVQFLLAGFYLVYLSSSWDPERRFRGWHDHAAGSVVIKR